MLVFHQVRHNINRNGFFYYKNIRFQYLAPETMIVDDNSHELYYSSKTILTINGSDFPASLKTLKMYFTPFSSYSFKLDYLPPTLSCLQFYHTFNEPVNSLPPSLTQISFSYCFNQSVDCLPSNLLHLSFNGYFNQTINSLPPKLQSLKIQGCFNHSVDSLPPNLISLHLGEVFNQPVDHLPHSLTKLTFESAFNQPVVSLPYNISTIIFGFSFDQPISFLPPSVTALELCSDISLLHFHPNISYLNILNASSISFLPSVTRLSFGHYFNQPLPVLPPSLTHLSLGTHFTHNIDVSTSKLRVLLVLSTLCGTISFPPCLQMFICSEGYKFIKTVPSTVLLKMVGWMYYISSWDVSKCYCFVCNLLVYVLF